MEKISSKHIIWGGLLLLILCEYYLFRTYILRDIVPYYPKSFDQTFYLAQSYKLYENMIEKGRILKHLTHLPSLPQTLLFHAQAALCFLFFGASRLTALSINFIYFALLQLFSFAVFKKISGKYSYGFLFIGFLLSAKTLVMANDFRIDFIACCLYGMFCCSILQSKIFLSRKWTLISFFLSIILMLMRYLTACYVIGLIGLMFAYYLILYAINRRTNQDISHIKIRIKHIFFFILGLASIILPILWFNRVTIYNYYVVGHITGAEKAMRFQSALLSSNTTYAILFYPKVFFSSHFSVTSLMQISAVLIIYAMVYLIIRFIYPCYHPASTTKVSNLHDVWVFLFFSLLVPLTILSIDELKSFLVISIILIPFIYLLIFVTMKGVHLLDSLAKSIANNLLIATASLFMLIGSYNFIVILAKEKYHAYADDKDHVVSKLVEDVGSYANFLRWSDINATSDYAADYINAPIAALYYENHGVLFNLKTLPLGNNVMTAITKQTALESLGHADIFTANLRQYEPDKIFPFEKSIHAFRPLLHKVAENKFIKLNDYYISDSMFRVYVKPDIRITGLIDNWITDQGIWLNIPSVVAQQIKIIHLEGDSDFSWLHTQKLRLHARREVNKKYISVNSQLKISGNHYQLTCQLPEWNSNKPLLIHLTFSHSYKVDGNPNNLVMHAPSKKKFFKCGCRGQSRGMTTMTS